MSYIAVIGAGSWGTTLACLLNEKGYDVSLWVYEKDLAEEIKKTRVNSLYLPGHILNDNILVTDDLKKAVNKALYIVNAVPSQHVRRVFGNAISYLREEAVIISVSKGIEKGSLLTISSILREMTGQRIAVLSGPSFAKEVIKKLPAAVTLATEDKKLALLLQEMFNTSYFRVYTHNDILGVELGGALKNVMAIAAGISDGLGLGYNARAALITRGLSEMKRLGKAMGAKEETFTGLSGLGDLVLTCTAPLSRNYTLGYELGKGRRLEEVVYQTKGVIEGVDTAESAYELSKRYNIQMPIVEQVYNVIYKGKSPFEAVGDLMNRTLKTEFDD
jgi:glycerol-3-phosphate dehydrogenase (NAD(P)+)